MSIIGQLMEMLSPRKAGPEYTLGDLERHHEGFMSHAKRAQDLVEGSLSRESLVRVSEELGRSRFTYMWNYRSWMDDEFIPKIRKFSNADTTSSVLVSPLSSDSVAFHLEEAVSHSEGVMNALRFFVCDSRSSFRTKDAFPDERSVTERAEFVSGGMRIVADNMKRIVDAISLASRERSAT